MHKNWFNKKRITYLVQGLSLSALLFGTIGYTLTLRDGANLNQLMRTINYANSSTYARPEVVDITLTPEKVQNFLNNPPMPSHKPMQVDALYTSINTKFLSNIFFEHNGVRLPQSGYSRLRADNDHMATEYYKQNEYHWQNNSHINHLQIGIKLNPEGTITPHSNRGPVSAWGPSGKLIYGDYMEDDQYWSRHGTWITSFISDYVYAVARNVLSFDFSPNGSSLSRYSDSIKKAYKSSYAHDHSDFQGNWFSVPVVNLNGVYGDSNAKFSYVNYDGNSVFKLNGIEIKSNNVTSPLNYFNGSGSGSFDASSGTNMYVFRQNRNIYHDWDDRWNLIPAGTRYYMEDGFYPHAQNFVIEEGGNDNNFWLRLAADDSWNGIPLIGVTGNNKFYPGLGRKIYSERDYYTGSTSLTQGLALLAGLSDFTLADKDAAKYQNIDKFININSRTIDEGKPFWTRGVSAMFINLPFFYSKKDRTWYLITDRFILSDKLQSSQFEISPKDNNIKKQMQNMFPSTYLKALNEGDRSKLDWFNLVFKNEKDHWTTPSDWWEFLPKYSLRADDVRGQLRVNIEIPTFGSDFYEYNNSSKAGFKNYVSRKVYALDRVKRSNIELVIDGWKDTRTQFKSIDIINFEDQFRTLASNIENFDPKLINDAIKQKYLSTSISVPGSNYLDNVELLELNKNDLIVSFVSSNLRAGQATYKVTLRKWIDGSRNWHENVNDDNAITRPYRRYTMTGFYRINGRTQLQKGALKVPDKWKNSLPSSIEQLKDEVKNHIIEVQHEGVVKTIESNYQDFSNEVFTNLGDYLKYKSSDFTIREVLADDDNGILYVNYRLAKTYDTEVDNSNITNTPQEGIIALHGFKTNNKNKIAYNINQTSLYADQYGLVSGDINNGTYLTPNDGVWQEQNSSVNDGTIILSQQYVQSKKARAALVYDPSRPFDLIIRMYQRSNMVSEHVYKNLFNDKILYLKKGDILSTNDKKTLVDSFSGKDEESWTMCNADGKIISKYDLSNRVEYLEKSSKIDLDKKETYEVKQDLYKLVPKSRNLFFNRMIPILNDEGLNTDKMIIFNQEPYLYKNETKTSDKLFIVDFSKLVDNKPKLQPIVLNEIKDQWITSASATARYENNDLQYLLSLVVINPTNNKKYLTSFVLDKSFNVDASKVTSNDISGKYEIVMQSKDVWKKLIYQSPQFSVVYDPNTKKYRSTLVLVDDLKVGEDKRPEINSKSEVRYSMYVSKDNLTGKYADFNRVNIIDPVSGNIMADNQVMPWNTNGATFKNMTFSNDMSEMYFVYKNNGQVLGVNYNLDEIALNGSIDKVKHVNILHNKNLCEDDVIYPQKDNPKVVNIAFSNKKTNFTNVKTTSDQIEIQVSSNFATMNLSSITSDIIKRDFFTLDQLRSFVSNTDYTLNNDSYSFNNIVPDYYNGFVYANLVLNNNFNFGFDKLSTVSYPIVFKGFNRQSKATTITINETGKNYFKQLKITEIEAKIKELASNNQLNKYFQILNEPNNKSIDEALVGYKVGSSNPAQSIASIKFDSNNAQVTIGFNVKEVFGSSNGDIFKLYNHIINVDVPITKTDTSNIVIDTVDIYGNQWKSVTAYEMREDYIKNMNGPNVEKLKDAIIKKLELTGIVTRQDISISNQIEFNNGEGKLFLSFSIDKLVIYDDSFANINLTIKGFKKITGTSIVKRADHFTNINPSKLQSYLNQNIHEKSLEFVTITNPLSNTEIVSANVLKYDDELGTAQVQFSAMNFNNSGLNQLPSASSNNSTLNAIFTFENLRGSSTASLTSIDAQINASKQYGDTVAQDFANNVNVNNSIAINLLTQTNAIKNQAPNTNINVTSIAFDNKQGMINIKFTMDKYLGTDNNVVNKPITFNSIISGFKKITGHTSYSLKTTLPNWTYEQALETLRNNPNEIKRLIDIQNLPDNANFTITKVVNLSNSYVVYAQLDKYYINDDFYTIGTNQEVNITIKRTQTYMYYVDSVTYDVNKLDNHIMTATFENTPTPVSSKGSILFLLLIASGLSVLTALVVSWGYKKANKQKNN